MTGNRWMEKQYNQMALLGLWLHCPCHTLRTKLPCHLLHRRQLFQSPGRSSRKKKTRHRRPNWHTIFPTKYWAGFGLTHILSKASNTMPGIKQQIVHWQSTVFFLGGGASQKWSMLRASATQTHFIVYTTPRSSCNKLTRFFVFTDCLVKEPQIHSNPGKQRRQSQPRGRNLQL